MSPVAYDLPQLNFLERSTSSDIAGGQELLLTLHAAVSAQLLFWFHHVNLDRTSYILVSIAWSICDAESLASSSPTCSTLGPDSPTAAQQHKQQRQRPYKVHGMDPYDYW